MIEPQAVAAILLAAGRSSRFGDEDKLLAPLHGKPLIWHAARSIVELGPARRIAVCPDADGAVATLLAGLGFEIVANADTALGTSASLRRGIGALRAVPEQAALVCLGDMPFVGAGHLRAILARFDTGAAPVVASGLDGTPMPPALFDRALFETLERAEGDRGGRDLLAAAPQIAASRRILADIDRRSDLSED